MKEMNESQKQMCVEFSKQVGDNVQWFEMIRVKAPSDVFKELELKEEKEVWGLFVCCERDCWFYIPSHSGGIISMFKQQSKVDLPSPQRVCLSGLKGFTLSQLYKNKLVLFFRGKSTVQCSFIKADGVKASFSMETILTSDAFCKKLSESGFDRIIE